MNVVRVQQEDSHWASSLMEIQYILEIGTPIQELPFFVVTYDLVIVN